MQTTLFQAPKTTLRHANTRMLNRYMPWIDYMLNITFGKLHDLSAEPTYEQASAQIRHLGATLNSEIWGSKSKFNAKCRILYVPIIEGAKDSKRIHAHILVGNVKSRSDLDAHMRSYIPRSQWLLPRYTVSEQYDQDGLGFYAAKETNAVNCDAIDWTLASIPAPLMP
jgi:hypothetical protein